MLRKEPLDHSRIRKITGTFGWIPQRFITNGHIGRFSSQELLLYFFLSVVGDKYGLSFYGDSRICELLKIRPETLKLCRQQLEEQSLIKYQKPLYQVLSLPKVY